MEFFYLFSHQCNNDLEHLSKALVFQRYQTKFKPLSLYSKNNTRISKTYRFYRSNQSNNYLIKQFPKNWLPHDSFWRGSVSLGCSEIKRNNYQNSRHQKSYLQAKNFYDCQKISLFSIFKIYLSRGQITLSPFFRWNNYFQGQLKQFILPRTTCDNSKNESPQCLKLQSNFSIKDIYQSNQGLELFETSLWLLCFSILLVGYLNCCQIFTRESHRTFQRFQNEWSKH